MAFKAKTISAEESIDIRKGLAESVHVEVKETKEELRKDGENAIETTEKKEKTMRKKSVKNPKVNWDEKIKEAGIDYEKWMNYKKITLIKPMELIEEDDIQTVAVPQPLLRKLDTLTKYNPSVFKKTIVTNLIKEFLEKNKDILELIEKEYNKNKKSK